MQYRVFPISLNAEGMHRKTEKYIKIMTLKEKLSKEGHYFYLQLKASDPRRRRHPYLHRSLSPHGPPLPA